MLVADEDFGQSQLMRKREKENYGYTTPLILYDVVWVRLGGCREDGANCPSTIPFYSYANPLSQPSGFLERKKGPQLAIP